MVLNRGFKYYKLLSTYTKNLKKSGVDFIALLLVINVLILGYVMLFPLGLFPKKKFGLLSIQTTYNLFMFDNV